MRERANSRALAPSDRQQPRQHDVEQRGQRDQVDPRRRRHAACTVRSSATLRSPAPSPAARCRSRPRPARTARAAARALRRARETCSPSRRRSAVRFRARTARRSARGDQRRAQMEEPACRAARAGACDRAPLAREALQRRRQRLVEARRAPQQASRVPRSQRSYRRGSHGAPRIAATPAQRGRRSAPRRRARSRRSSRAAETRARRSGGCRRAPTATRPKRTRSHQHRPEPRDAASQRQHLRDHRCARPSRVAQSLRAPHEHALGCTRERVARDRAASRARRACAAARVASARSASDSSSPFGSLSSIDWISSTVRACVRAYAFHVSRTRAGARADCAKYYPAQLPTLFCAGRSAMSRRMLQLRMRRSRGARRDGLPSYMYVFALAHGFGCSDEPAPSTPNIFTAGVGGMAAGDGSAGVVSAVALSGRSALMR